MTKEIEQTGKNLVRALQGLPLLNDDHYLRMQAMNLGMVDDFLMDAEHRLLQEYHEIERTPMLQATFVTAMTQLWIFGVYELLRTWRQRVQEVLAFADEISMATPAKRAEKIQKKKAELSAAASTLLNADDRSWRTFKKASDEPKFVESLHAAKDASARIFRKLEILRIHLAKHEQHKAKGLRAVAPGYGRIDMETGTIYFQVTLPSKALPGEVDVISRRNIADGCRDFLNDKAERIVPRSLRKQLKEMPEFGYGVRRIKATLKDGSVHEGVFVYADVEVVGAKKMFDARDIVQVAHDP